MPRKSSRLEDKQKAQDSHSNPTRSTRPAPSKSATRHASNPTRGTRAATRSTTRSAARIQEAASSRDIDDHQLSGQEEEHTGQPSASKRKSRPPPKQLHRPRKAPAPEASIEPDPHKSDDSDSRKSDDSDSEAQKQKAAEIEAELNKPDDSDSTESDNSDLEATHQDKKSNNEEADPDPGLIETNQALP